MNNQEVYLEMKAAEEALAVKKAVVTERVKSIFERYAAIYNRYHAVKLNVEDFDVFTLLEQANCYSFLYISDCNNPLMQMELDSEYFFNTDATLEWYEQTLKMEASEAKQENSNGQFR